MAGASRRGLAAAGAAACAAAVFQMTKEGSDGRARCQFLPFQSASRSGAAPSEADVAAFMRTLARNGSDVDGIAIKPSDKDAGRLGVYATEAGAQRAAKGWWGRLRGWVAPWAPSPTAVLASFPLSSVLTAGNLTALAAAAASGGEQAPPASPAAAPAACAAAAAVGATPQAAALLRELMQLGLADERTVVILHLAVQRRLWQEQQQRQRQRQAGGAAGVSGLAPWLALLPDSFSTPLFYSDADLDWLRGTTLHAAALVRRRALESSWRRLEPAACQLASAAGASSSPSLEDFQWAHSVFWSRAIAFPAPSAAGPEGSGKVEMAEGIVPGLDFCNHDPGSTCRWTVFGAPDAPLPGAVRPPSAVSLVCPRGAGLRAGQEVTINYGDKSNEELLFLYGFAQQDNPHEVLTVMCPLPLPEEWDATLQARLELLRLRGAKPQVFLPASDLKQQQLAAAASAGSKAGRRRNGKGGLAPLALPGGVVETLEVFAMGKQQLAAALEAPAAAATEAAAGAGPGGAGSRTAERQQRVQAASAGLRLAVLTTLTRLLELKAAEMECSETGTGPLEADEALLARAGEVLSTNQRNALLYRIGQKRLARQYLQHSAALLQSEMERLARAQS